MRSLVVIGAVLALTLTQASAESKGGGAKEFAPGQRQTEPGSAKKYAPGQKQKKPGQAKKFAPGQQNK
jgi:hypothetical protein